MNELFSPFPSRVVTDLECDARWYDDRSAGFGAEFLHESRIALDRIVRQPEQVAADATRIRSLRLHWFPHVVGWWCLASP